MRLARFLSLCRLRFARRSDPGVAIRASSRRRGALLTAAVACGWPVLCSPELRAGEAVVTAPDAVVRSIPFEVAPKLAHVHAGDKLMADDKPTGAWRRVKLPDGRFGVVHDADVKVTVSATPPSPPAPSAPPAPAATPQPPSAPPSPAVAASSPRERKAKVAVFAAPVREAPSAHARVLTVVAEGTELVVFGDAPGGWRLVSLPDGQSGFVAAVAVATTEAYVASSSRAQVGHHHALVVLPASARWVSAPIVRDARQLLVMDLYRALHMVVIDYDRPPVEVQLDPTTLASVAASVGGRLAVVLDMSREAGVTTLDVTCYDAASGAPACHARESTGAGPEVLPAIMHTVTASVVMQLVPGARFVQGLDARAGGPPHAAPSPHTVRVGSRAVVMVPVVTVGGDAGVLGGWGFTGTVNVKRSFADLIADLGEGNGRHTLGIGAGFYSRLSSGAGAPFVGGSVHWVSQQFGGRGASGAQLRPTVGFVWLRDDPVQLRLDVSYFIDLFEERTVDRLIAGSDATYVSHGPMVSLGPAF